MTLYYHHYLIHMVRLHHHPGLRHLPNFDLGHKWPSSSDESRSKEALSFCGFVRTHVNSHFLYISPLIVHYLGSPLSLRPHFPFPITAAVYSDCRPRICFLLLPPVIDLMDPPPTGLLAGRVLRLHHHDRPYLILTGFRSVHHPGTFDLNPTANLNFYGSTGWFALLPG